MGVHPTFPPVCSAGVRIYTFGGFRIERDGTRVPSRRSLPLLRLELLTCLIEAGREGASMMRLTRTLYSAYYGSRKADGHVFEEPDAVGALHDLLYRLRQMLGSDSIERFGDNRVRWNTMAVWIDAYELLSLYRKGAVSSSAELRQWVQRHAPGPYLDGIPRSPDSHSVLIAAARKRFDCLFDAIRANPAGTCSTGKMPGEQS